MVLLRSRIGCDHWLMALCSQSNQRRWMYWTTWDSLSIGPRISTCWWCVGRSGRSVTECLCCGRIVVGGVPTLQVGDWLVSELGRVVDNHHVLDVVLRNVVERLSAE